MRSIRRRRNRGQRHRLGPLHRHTIRARGQPATTAAPPGLAGTSNSSRELTLPVGHRLRHLNSIDQQRHRSPRSGHARHRRSPIRGHPRHVKARQDRGCAVRRRRSAAPSTAARVRRRSSVPAAGAGATSPQCCGATPPRQRPPEPPPQAPHKTEISSHRNHRRTAHQHRPPRARAQPIPTSHRFPPIKARIRPVPGPSFFRHGTAISGVKATIFG